MDTFTSLGLSSPVLAAVEQFGHTTPTPIQAQAITPGLEKHDVLAAAQTGTGKTLAYLLPIFDNMVRFYGSRRPKKGGPYVLVLAPTRELATQIYECAAVLAQTCNFRVVNIIGGKKYSTQIKRLNAGCDVLIATPGRLTDLAKQRAVSLNKIHYLVLDEVDRMMDMGFWPSVHAIVRTLPKKRQTFLFSATLSAEVKAKATLVQANPVVIEIAQKGQTAETVREYILPVSEHQKQDLLVALLEEQGDTRIIVFTPTKQEADACARRLQKANLKADSIHADKPQNKRDRALRNFREGAIDVLVATDVLARGIDVAEVSYVVNYTVPAAPDDYIHRIGRTGRAGMAGRAYTFLTPSQLLEFREIEYHTGHLMEVHNVESFSYEGERIVPDPKRPTKRGVRRGNARRPSLRRR